MTRGLVLLVLAACGQAKPADEVAAGAAVAPVAADAPRVPAPSPPAPPPSPRPPHPLRRGEETPAIRCTADGGPLYATRDGHAMLHLQSRFSLAVTPAGDVYTSDNLTIARWKLEATPGACTLRLDPTYGVGGKVEIPVASLHSQNFDSNIAAGYCTRPRPHRRATGDACDWSWTLAASPSGAVYITDKIIGTYRVDRGSVEPTCPDDGYRRLVFAPDGRAIGDLSSDLDLATCRSTLVPWAPKEQHDGPTNMLAGFFGNEPVIDRDGMFVGSLEFGHRYKEPQTCQTAMAFACDDDLCFADSGCMRVTRFSRTGAFRGAWTLWSPRDDGPVPDRMVASARMPDGNLLVLTVYRYWRHGTQRPDDQNEVWPAVVPAASFAP